MDTKDKIKQLTLLEQIGIKLQILAILFGILALLFYIIGWIIS